MEQTFAGLSQPTTIFLEAKALSVAKMVTVLARMTVTKPMPANKGDTIYFRRPILVPPNTTPLAEGVTPAAKPIGYQRVSAQLQQYGDLYGITDKVNDLATDPVLNDAMMVAGRQVGDTEEQIVYGVAKAGTNVFYANGATRAGVNTAITLNKQRAVIRNLLANRAQRKTTILDGSANYNTTPVEAAFVAIAHTDLEADIRGLAGFRPVSEYGSGKPICPEELGKVENVRYILSPMLDPFFAAGSAALNGMKSVGAVNVDVYPVLYLGEECLGSVPVKGQGAMTPYVIPVDKPDKADPLAQRGYVGWKFWMTAVRLNELWMARLEVGVTNL
jgi:N4-gp56 family major capsid protein